MAVQLLELQATCGMLFQLDTFGGLTLLQSVDEILRESMEALVNNALAHHLHVRGFYPDEFQWKLLQVLHALCVLATCDLSCAGMLFPSAYLVCPCCKLKRPEAPRLPHHHSILT